MLGRGNNTASAAGGGYGSAGGRRHVNSAMVQAHILSPTFSPHSMYTPVDPYRTNGSATIAEPFPATPYTPISSLFMSPNVQNALATPQNVRQRRPVTHVTSSKFATYTTIFNLEAEAKPSVLMPKQRTQVYQTSARYTGKDILLRRLVNVVMSPEECNVVLEAVRQYRHPNLVPLTNVFPTDEFIMGSSDAMMEYRFIPGAKSLQEAFMSDTTRATEGLLWSFTCQMVGLLRSFHETVLPLRWVHLSKLIYVEATGRFYYTGLGLADLLYEMKVNPTNVGFFMKQDIQSLGLILLQLATNSYTAKPDAFIAKQHIPGFSQSFCELVKTCLDGSVDSAHLCHALGERMSMEVGHQQGHADYLLLQCSREVHNGRLMRLMMKLNFVLESLNDLQDYSPDTQRYALRLFNQFVFNQVDEQNRIHVDWGHAFHCLNKLDCGSEETIQLISNDSTTAVLVISYADLRSILDTLFDQLQQISSHVATGEAMESPIFMAASPGSP